VLGASACIRGIGALVVAAALLPSGLAYGATTRVVGPGHAFPKPCAAITASGTGDTVQIDAAGNGNYDGDVCSSSASNLTIEGINGRPHIDAAGQNSGGKGIWVFSGSGVTVRNVELSGASVPDMNGAAIRYGGTGNLDLVGSYIHNNQEGILVDAGTTGDVTVDSTEFASNGAGDGQSHNIYIAAAHSFTLRYSFSHDANAGHLVKSRAATNNIYYNRLTEQSGTGAYELDISNGGLTYVIGNVFQQGNSTTNGTMLAYQSEAASNPDQHLYAVNNTFVNDRTAGGTVINLGSSASPALVENNIFVGAGTLVNQAGASQVTNCVTTSPAFTAPTSFDYHLQATSPCRDAGTTPAPSVTPNEQYVYDVGHGPRSIVGSAIDAGAFEYAPPDSDGDGIPDASDSCPSQSDASAPRDPRDGCAATSTPPPDSDGDGIPDASDACPTTSDAAAPRNPRNGCPVVPVPPQETNGNDTISGNNLANVICGLLGNDTLNGLGGNDTLWGDRCNDKTKSVFATAAVKDGNDVLNGGDGNDKLYGAGGNDKLNGGKGNDKLVGGGGNDKLNGGPGKNSYSGGSGNDTINARNGKKETVDCGSGKKDTATVDKRDKTKGCEKVKRARK
jgi:Ca2+-binding RTX toxin-like protein